MVNDDEYNLEQSDIIDLDPANPEGPEVGNNNNVSNHFQELNISKLVLNVAKIRSLTFWLNLIVFTQFLFEFRLKRPRNQMYLRTKRRMPYQKMIPSPEAFL